MLLSSHEQASLIESAMRAWKPRATGADSLGKKLAPACRPAPQGRTQRIKGREADGKSRPGTRLHKMTHEDSAGPQAIAVSAV